MKISDIFRFIFLEIKKAIEEKNQSRVLELGTAVDVLYEISKKQKDRKAQEILDRLDYVVNHYQDEFSFADDYLKEIEKTIIQIQNQE